MAVNGIQNQCGSLLSLTPDSKAHSSKVASQPGTHVQPTDRPIHPIVDGRLAARSESLLPHSTLCLATRRRLFYLFVTSTIAYLTWRATCTLNPDHPGFSLLFLICEIAFALFGTYFFACVSHAQEVEEPPSPTGQETVDVFITTYNEDVSLVRMTARAARDLNRPHKTWICDDGRRPEMEELARELGVGYVTREDNSHYKAGNINHALSRTKGQYVLILDADHVPRQDMLDQLLGYFRDANVAFVQTPQIFYNVDSFQHVPMGWRRKTVWHESSVFHHLIQPGLNRWNAAFFIGSGAIHRRQALEQIGGIATGTITEDVLTSMRLHARGYRSIYVNKPLGFLLAPETPLAFAAQRLRWAQGGLQILRTECPLLRRGLSWQQRLGYFQSLAVYFMYPLHLLFYVTPALYLVGGMSPLSFSSPVFFGVLAAYWLTNLCIYKALTGPLGSMFFSECYRILLTPICISAIGAFLRPKHRPFRVTPKGTHQGLPPFILVIPTLMLWAIQALALAAGLAMAANAPDDELMPVVLAIGFAALFFVVNGLALIHMFDRRSVKEPFAFPVDITGRIETLDTRVRDEARLRRISHEFAYVSVRTASFLPGDKARLHISLMGQDRFIQTEVTDAHPMRRSSTRDVLLRLRFLNVGPRDHEALDRLMFNVVLPEFFLRQARPKPEKTESDHFESEMITSAGAVKRMLRLRPGILAPVTGWQWLRMAGVFGLIPLITAARFGMSVILPPATATHYPPVALASERFLEEFEQVENRFGDVSHGWANGGFFNNGWRADHVRTKAGVMTLKLDADGCPAACSGKPFASGEYRSRHFTGYGRVEARMKAARSVGVVTSVFTYTGPSDGNPWDEIDIEVLGRDTTMLQTNYITDGQGGHETTIQLGFDAAEDFHDYAFEWSPHAIHWYVDGKRVHSEHGVRGPLPSHPGRISANLWPGKEVRHWLGDFQLGRNPIEAQYESIGWIPQRSLHRGSRSRSI
jgi:cellulose synthase/poly-beta-1,6-N-acetylglucosamine synthase-like glycosyltransferase/beta-glucanase (GH16 family)